MLNKNQTKWILKNLKEFLDRNLGALPFREEDWLRIRDEAVELEKRVNHHKDCCRLITQTLLYLEAMERLGVFPDKEGGE